MRLAPLSESRPQDQPGFNRLHHVCQLWVDYLTTKLEAEKHQLLHEAVVHLTHYRQQGDEGEEVVQHIWSAVRRRGMVYQDARHWAEAMDNGHCVLKGTPRQYPFTYRCTCGNESCVSFRDFNHDGQTVPCNKCGADASIRTDVKAMEAAEAQDKADDVALTNRLNNHDHRDHQ